MPSHNCIIIHNVQFSRCIFESLFQETQWSSFFWSYFSQSLVSIRFSKWWAKDSLFCGKATPVATVHRTVPKTAFRVHFGALPFWTRPSRSWLLSKSFSKWWAKMDSNHRPHDYQSCALASWAIGPYQLHFFFRYMVEISGIEPLTSCLQGRRSPSWAKPPYPLFTVPSKLNNTFLP